MISSLQNQLVKDTVKLREGKRRREDGRFIIDGRREISRAIASGVKIDKIFYVAQQCESSLMDSLEHCNAELIEVTEPVLEKIAFGNRDEGAVAVAFRPMLSLDDIQLSDCPLIGVAEGVEKPGNLGALLRSADGAGVDVLILADCKTDVYNPNSVRASLGTLFSVPVIETSSQKALEWLIAHKIAIYAALVDGAIEYNRADYTVPCAIVLGSEADGLTGIWRGENVQPIRLPMNGIADSLNVSVTAGILFYSAISQRSGKN